MNPLTGMAFFISNTVLGQSQWLRDLRRGSAAVRLLGLWVRSRRGHGCLYVVSVVCCKVEISALGLSLVQRNPIDCCVSECVRESSIMMRPWPRRGCCAVVKKKPYVCFVLLQ